MFYVLSRFMIVYWVEKKGGAKSDDKGPFFHSKSIETHFRFDNIKTASSIHSKRVIRLAKIISDAGLHVVIDLGSHYKFRSRMILLTRFPIFEGVVGFGVRNICDIQSRGSSSIDDSLLPLFFYWKKK